MYTYIIGERRKEKGERRKEKGERRKEKGERRKEKGEYTNRLCDDCLLSSKFSD